MRRILLTVLLAGVALAGSRAIHAQGDGGYRLVTNWPKLPTGMYFGLKDAPPPPAEREAQAAARAAVAARRIPAVRPISRVSPVWRSTRRITSTSSTAA